MPIKIAFVMIRIAAVLSNALPQISQVASGIFLDIKKFSDRPCIPVVPHKAVAEVSRGTL